MDAKNPKETLKTQLQDVLAKAVNCKGLAESLRSDLIPPAAAGEGKQGPDAPPPTTTVALVQEAQDVLSDTQEALRYICDTLQG